MRSVEQIERRYSIWVQVQNDWQCELGEWYNQNNRVGYKFEKVDKNSFNPGEFVTGKLESLFVFIQIAQPLDIRP